MEPRTSSPTARLRTIHTLADAGVPVRVMTAPIIPGLNDNEVPAILAAAAEAGATSAGYVLLRLPLSVKPVFLEWLDRTRPDSRPRIEALIRSTRDGELSSSEFGSRMRGSGEMAGQITQLFKTFARKHHLDHPLPPLDFEQFRPPVPASGQMRLF
jgi:DNA repair photolyase